MPITITAFGRSPDGGTGLARDIHVRWALEDVGQTYAMRLVDLAGLNAGASRARSVGANFRPVRRELALFDTGAIVLNIAQTHADRLPADFAVRARAMSWMFPLRSVGRYCRGQATTGSLCAALSRAGRNRRATRNLRP